MIDLIDVFDSSRETQLQTDAANVTSAVVVTTSRRATSILASLDAEEFCDDSNHQREAPTKHNVLCEERSVWDVIQQHVVDFASAPQPHNNNNNNNNSNSNSSSSSSRDGDGDDDDDFGSSTDHPDDAGAPAAFSAPQFHYIAPSATRYVLLLDRSQMMAKMVILFRIFIYLKKKQKKKKKKKEKKKKKKMPSRPHGGQNRWKYHQEISEIELMDDTPVA